MYMGSESEYIEFLTDERVCTDSLYETTDRSKNAKVISKVIPFAENRTGELQNVKYIVIHETSLGTGRATPDRDYLHYYEALVNSDSQVGYHYLCDDDNVYEFIPEFERTCHTGTPLNMMSVGVERLVNENISFPDALYNQAKLVATLMYKWGVPIRNVVTHLNTRIMFNRERKQCPARMLDHQYGGEDKFYNEIIYCIRNKDFFYEILNVSLSIPKSKR